jgi:DNA-binding MarR family transcriptional regulator
MADARDRRCVTHSLTPSGHTALTDGDHAVRARLEAIVSHLPARQRRTAIDSLALWLGALDLHRAAQEPAAT